MMVHRVLSSSLSVLCEEGSEPDVGGGLVVEGGGRLLPRGLEQLQRGEVLDDDVVLEQVGHVLHDKLRDELLEHVLLGLLAALHRVGPAARAANALLSHHAGVELLQVVGVAAGNLGEDVDDAGVPRPHGLVGHDGQLHQRDVVALVPAQLQNSRLDYNRKAKIKI